MQAFASVFYGLFQAMLTLIDYMQVAFDVLIGMQEIIYTPDLSKPLDTQKMALLDVMFFDKSISTALMMITMLGVGLSMLFSIYAAARSTLDFDFENKRPVKQVLKSCIKTAFSFMLVPVMAVGLIKLSGVMLVGLDRALTGDMTQNVSIGTNIFLVATLKAAKVPSFNEKPSFNDALRIKYVKRQKSTDSKIGGYYEYSNTELVEKDFELANIDYIIGYGSALFMVVILAICLILFIQRIFEILVLYLVSPLFVSVMPLDDGEKFGKWREMFIAKIFLGFGSAIGMRVYLMFMPIIMNDSIDFSKALHMGSANENVLNYVIRLLFILGGAYGVLKSSSLITSILNYQAAQQESGIASGVAAGIYANTYMKVSNAGFNKVRGAISQSHQKSLQNKQERIQDRKNFSNFSKNLAGSTGMTGMSRNKVKNDRNAWKECMNGENGGGSNGGGNGGTPQAMPKRASMKIGKRQYTARKNWPFPVRTDDVNRFHGLLKTRYNPETGKREVAKVRFAGLRFKADESGSLKFAGLKLGGAMTFKKFDNGQIKLTSALGGRIQNAYGDDEHGNFVRAGTSAFGMEFKNAGSGLSIFDAVENPVNKSEDKTTPPAPQQGMPATPTLQSATPPATPVRNFMPQIDPSTLQMGNPATPPATPPDGDNGGFRSGH